MKAKIIIKFIITFLISLLFFTSCSGPSSSDSNNSDSETISLPDSFIRGFDLSSADYWENDYAELYNEDENWYDTDGSQKSLYEILKNHGINTVRIRVWVDPENAPVTDSNWPAANDWHAGDCTTERAVRMAKEANKAGLKILLDFHYSDYWTDPGKQLIPLSWQNAASSDEMAEKISSYTTEVLTALNNESIIPDYVQVGNEIDSGILLHTSYSTSSGTVSGDKSLTGNMESTYGNFKSYISAGCKAVRDFDEGIKIIMHVTNEYASWTIQKIESYGIDYDIIGLSYYPWEANHGNIAKLKSNISSLKNTYSKPVIVAETSAHWNCNKGEADTDRAYSAAHMINPDTDGIYSDLETETVNGSLQMIGSVENQKNIIRHIMEEAADSGASGLFVWGGERRGDWKYAFFDWEGKAFDSLDWAE